MEFPNSVYRVTIKGLVTNKENRFLLCREENNLWSLPGGGMDFGELPDQTLKRGFLEEMGVELIFIDDKPQLINTSKSPKGHWQVDLVFKVVPKNLEIIKSNECQEIGFFTKDEALKLPLVPNLELLINQF